VRYKPTSFYSWGRDNDHFVNFFSVSKHFSPPPPPTLVPMTLSSRPPCWPRWADYVLRDTQGFGMQCASYICHETASHPGIMARTLAFCQPLFLNYRLLEQGYCHLSRGLHTSCPSYGSFTKTKTVYTFFLQSMYAVCSTDSTHDVCLVCVDSEAVQKGKLGSLPEKEDESLNCHLSLDG
jgi:hypothetical protein